MEWKVNTLVKVPFIGPTTGLTSFPEFVTLVDGEAVTTTPTFTEIGGGLYVASFTPVTTGRWSVFVADTLHEFSVVARLSSEIIQNLEDESLGSWIWDKNSGVLTALRQDGSELCKFNVTESSVSSSRERI